MSYMRQKLVDARNMKSVCCNKEYTIVSNVGNFSNESIHRPGLSPKEFICTKLIGDEKAEHYDRFIEEPPKKFQYPLTIYANGHDSTNIGYISIIFKGEDVGFLSIEFKCLVAVIDSRNDQRYTQSFCFNFNHDQSQIFSKGCYQWPIIVIDKFLSRKVLLDEASELLPGDNLTLHINIFLQESGLICTSDSYAVIWAHSRLFDLQKCFKEDKNSAKFDYHLLLDSPLGKNLIKNSNFFRGVVENTSKSEDELPIPVNEIDSFMRIGFILNEDLYVIFNSVEEIIDLYICADKYDILIVTELCRNFLKDCLTKENVLQISEVADDYNDKILTEYIKIHVKEQDNSKTEIYEPGCIIFKRLEVNESLIKTPEVDSPDKDFLDYDYFK